MDECELEIGIPDYYYEDLRSSEYDKLIEYMIREADRNGLSLDHYILEFQQ